MVLALLFATAAAAIGAAFPLTTGGLGTSATGTTPCDTDGITYSISDPMDFAAGSTPGFNYIVFNLSSIANACNGKYFKAQLSNSSGDCTASASGTLSVASSSATVTMRSVGCTLDFNTQLAMTIYD